MLELSAFHYSGLGSVTLVGELNPGHAGVGQPKNKLHFCKSVFISLSFTDVIRWCTRMVFYS